MKNCSHVEYWKKHPNNGVDKLEEILSWSPGSEEKECEWQISPDETGDEVESICIEWVPTCCGSNSDEEFDTERGVRELGLKMTGSLNRQIKVRVFTLVKFSFYYFFSILTSQMRSEVPLEFREQWLLHLDHRKNLELRLTEKEK